MSKVLAFLGGLIALFVTAFIADSGFRFFRGTTRKYITIYKRK